MPHDLPHSLHSDDAAELYASLTRRIERLEGHVQQLLAERTSHTLVTPTWGDIETIKKDIARLQDTQNALNSTKKLNSKGSSPSHR